MLHSPIRTRSQVTEKPEKSNENYKEMLKKNDLTPFFDDIKIYINEKVNELKSEYTKALNDIRKELNENFNQNKNIMKKEIYDDIDKFKADLEHNVIKMVKDESRKLSFEMNTIKQQLLSNKIEVIGISKIRNENDETLKNTVLNLANEMKVGTDKKDIINIYRKKNYVKNGLPGNIVIELSSSQKAAELIKGSRRTKPRGDRNIYFNEQLTKMNQFFQKKARDLKRKGIIKGFRLQRGTIFVLNEKEQQISIDDFLSKINIEEENNVQVSNEDNINDCFNNNNDAQ